MIKKDEASNSNDNMVDTSLEMASADWNSSMINPLVLSLIYKDHKMKKSDFLTKMQHLFRKHANDNSILLGDFNINTKEDRSLNDLAYKENFVPIVDCTTTIHGSILDQVFVNSTLLETISFSVEVLHSYFSDHDLVVLCIRKQMRNWKAKKKDKQKELEKKKEEKSKIKKDQQEEKKEREKQKGMGAS